MAIRFTPHLVDLAFNAAIKSYWRKKSLRKFLKQCHISEAFLNSWQEGESKRDFLGRLFDQLQETDRHRGIILTMAKFLAEQRSFPDLEGWEDSDIKVSEAKKAVAALRTYLEEQERTTKEEANFQEQLRLQREKNRAALTQLQTMDTLTSRLQTLSLQIGTQQAGYDFQDWFFDFLDFSEAVCRRPYVHSGRQIDGSVTVDGTTYLVELKFTKGQADAPDIDIFKSKVNSKADNTMGLMVSISGYSSVAVSDASYAKTPLLLLDHEHLYAVLTGFMTFDEIVQRVRRHASQTGEAYLRVGDM